MDALKKFLVEKFGLDAGSDDAAVKLFAAGKVKSGELELDQYMSLISEKSANPVDEIASRISAAIAEQFKSLNVAKPPEGKTEDPKGVSAEDLAKKLAELEGELLKKFEAQLVGKSAGGDGDSLMKMARDNFEDDSPAKIRVKGILEGYRDTKTALVYGHQHDKTLGRYGKTIEFNGKELNVSTERSKYMSAVWAKFQMFPENMSDREMEVVQHVLHNEKFHVPSANIENTDARKLTEHERYEVLDFNKNFYARGMYKADLLDDATSGGQYSVPEFFDYDMIIAPTLASENIISLCNVVPVPRGSSARNFILGRPTISAAPEGNAATPFDATAFIQPHNTPFFRQAGFLEIGRNFTEDAHPRLVQEIWNQYRASHALWTHEQIVIGDGVTEPLGILNTPSVIDIPATAGTGGAVGIQDVINLLFGVSKAYRFNGSSGRAAFIMTETLYKRIRSLATGLTGDERLLFGMDLENYMLLNHPVKIEEEGLSNSQVIFAQLAGYRMYVRQGLRLIREDRGRALTLSNTYLIGVDSRVGGQLDLPGYAAVIDDLAA